MMDRPKSTRMNFPQMQVSRLCKKIVLKLQEEPHPDSAGEAREAQRRLRPIGDAHHTSKSASSARWEPGKSNSRYIQRHAKTARALTMTPAASREFTE